MALVAVVLVPQLVLYYMGFKDVFSAMNDLMGAAQSSAPPPQSAEESSRILAAYANGAPYFVTLILFALVVVPLSNAAVVSGVSRAYLGMPVRFVDCYRDALARWPTLLGLMLLWFLAGCLAAGMAMIGFFLIGAGLVAMTKLLGIAGGILAALIGIAVGLGVLVLVLELYLAAAFSFVSAVLEGLNAGAAFTSGFARVFGEGQFWRSVAIAGAIFGIILGFEIVGAFLGMAITALTRSFALNFAVSGLIGGFTYPFLFAVVAVSYYDVRIRREGYDLQMLAAQLGANAPPASSAR
jgi:hypothetical protein